jgi:hypothetical protein
VLGSNCRQWGTYRFLAVLAEQTKRGGLRIELFVDALVAILRAGQTLLAPPGQLQENFRGYYRSRR